MEKFQSFTDAAQGVNPFAQKPVAASALAPVLALLRALLAAPVLVCCAAVDVAATCVGVLPCLGFAEWGLRLLLLRPLCTAAFLLLTWSLPRPLALLPPRSTSDRGPALPLSARDVLLVPCTGSPLVDILFWAAVGVPAFVTGGGGATTSSLFTALNSPGRGGAVAQITPAQWARLLSDRNDAWAGPLLFYPECAPTNGSAVLQFAPAVEALGQVLAGEGGKGSARVYVHVAGLRLSTPPGGAPLTLVAGGAAAHAWRVCGAAGAYSVGAVRLMSPPQPWEGGPQAWVDLARTAMVVAARVGVRPVALDWKAHAAFVAAQGGAS
jgi:hypothetical protein